MNCDAIAPYYASMEFAVFGHALERCRFHFLPELAGTRRALVLGDGDGRFLKRLLTEYPLLQADYVDCSAAMLQRARRAAGSERVHYLCADALQQLPGSGYDLVVSHFFLDCFQRDDQAKLIAHITQAAPQARWLISEFRIPQHRWLAAPARALIGVMYAFFSLATGLKTRTLADHRPLLRDAGFQLHSDATHARGLLVSELWTREAVE